MKTPDEKKSYIQDAKDGIPHRQTIEITPDGKTSISGSVPLSELFKGQPIIATTTPQEKILTTTDKPTPTLHRQARGYMRTTASLVGKDMSEERSLFDLPRFDNDIRAYKETLSQNTAIVGYHLFAKWQRLKDERGIYTIDNLKHFADSLPTTPQELKIYLIYLGGYQRPITKLNIIREKGKKEKRILSITHDKLFHIKFNIRLKDGETENDFTQDDRTGTKYLNFIRDRDIYSVEISPSISLQDELQGKGLGNVLTDDGLVAFSLGLSELAFKIFCYSGSHRPSLKIRFDKLISDKHLNLEGRVYGAYDNSTGKRLRAGKGKPKILTRIQEALQELLDKGHLVKYTYDKDKDLFSWTYSNKIIKHKEFLPLKVEAGQLLNTGPEQTRQDKTAP